MTTLSGKVWRFGDDINTDLILPGHATLLSRKEQVKYVFEANRPGWTTEVSAGDVIVAGRNFGIGSGRPAARALNDLGIAAIIAVSLSGLFLRNAVVSGVPALIAPNVLIDFSEGDIAEIDLDSWTLLNRTNGRTVAVNEMPPALKRPMLSGGVMPLLIAEGYVAST